MRNATISRYNIEVIDKHGNLVYGEKNRRLPFMSRYDSWRGGVCYKDRTKYTWKPFRRGDITPLTLGYSLYVYVKEKLNGSSK